MRKITLLLLVLASLVSDAVAQSPAVSPLIGIWESASVSRGGIGTTLVLAHQGSVALVIGVIANGRYAFDGSRLDVTDGDGSRKEMMLMIAGDTLLQSAGDSVVRMTRVAGFGPDTGLVGRWRFIVLGPNGQTAIGFVEYRADGAMRFRLPFRTDFGSYSLAGDRLTVTMPQLTRTARYTVVGDTLNLRFADGSRERMIRSR